ncbi:MAG: hypothetical protein KDC14_07095, partial [Planctomycetes bacterium]|nr:hypothetical protein [Planctomycetota bacterium]
MQRSQPEHPRALLEGVNPDPSEPSVTDVTADPASAAASPAPPTEGDEAPAKECALPTGAHAEVWKRIQAAVRERVQPEQFETWFRRAALHRVHEETVCIAVQNSFSRDWLQTYYQATIEDAVSASLGGPRRVEFHVDPELTMQRPNVDAALEQATSRNGSVNGSAQVRELPADHPDRARRAHSSPAFSRRTPSDTDRKEPPTSEERGRLLQDFAKGGLVRGSTIGLNPKYTFENYVMGPCNRFAHAAALGAAESPGSAYNPLFLHGSVGLGKTHLLQSLCFALLENFKDVRILYLSCETFVNHFISALDNGHLHNFPNKYRGLAALVADDIPLLPTKDPTPH